MYETGKIAEDKSEIVNIMLPNGTQKSGRIVFSCFNVKDAEDAKELNEHLSKGAEIALSSNEFVFTKMFEPSQIDVTGKINLGKK